MRLLPSAAALIGLLSLPLGAQENADYPVLQGYVTHVAANALDINGVHLLFTPASLSGIAAKGGIEFSHAIPSAYLGEPAKVFGTADRKRGTVTVERLLLTMPAATEISGEAIIDLLPAPSAATPPSAHLVRADGRLLLLTPATTIAFAPPLSAASPLTTNLWIRYQGEQRPDGIVLLREAHLRENLIAPAEDKLRTHAEYDPAAVDPDAHQSVAGKYFFGLDPKRVPPWPDAAMQERVSRLGARLVPAYQRALPADDPTRINFRFGVIDEQDLNDSRDPLTLPNGIILVPHQVVERLENDAQLAAVLAFNIARAIEKQTLRLAPAHHKMTAAAIAGSAASIAVPGLSLAAGAANYGVARHLLTLDEQQSGRTSLSYLADAGFDLTEAPIAWWRLGTRPDKPLAWQSLPPRAAYLFAALGTTWRSTVSPGFHELPLHELTPHQPTPQEPAGVPAP